MSYELSGDIINKAIESKAAADENNLIVKDYGGLYIIKYNKEKVNGSNIKELGLYRSFIVDNASNIICYSPPKSLVYEYFDQDVTKCYIEEFVEGTMINIFFNKSIDDWDLTTRSNIGAKCIFNLYFSDCTK